MMPNRKRKSHRRSSILKGGSPRDVLLEVDVNVDEPTTTLRKSRRVSFASTYMVKEFIKDSPKIPIAGNCVVPGLTGPPVGCSGTDPEAPVDNTNQTQWGDVTMDMTETISPGVMVGPQFSADPSPVTKVDSQSLLQRISGLKSSFNPRNLNEHGIQPSPANEDMNVTTGQAFGMEFTQCVGSSHDISVFSELATGKSLVEKTVIFQDENACDMSVTMCQPPLNLSTLHQPPISNPVVVTKSFLSKLTAFKKTANNSAWDKTRLLNSEDDSAIMELTCFPNTSVNPAEIQGASTNIEGSQQLESQQMLSMPPETTLSGDMNSANRLRPGYENATEALSPVKTGHSVSEMDLTCTKDHPSDRRRVSFAPIISTAFVLNDTASTVSSEQGVPNESFANGLTSSEERPMTSGGALNISAAGNFQNPEKQDPMPSSQTSKLVTSLLLSKLTSGSNKPKSALSADALLSKLTGGTNRSTVFGPGNDLETTKMEKNTVILSSKPTGLSNKTSLFSSENDMDMTGVLPSKPTGVTNKTTLFGSENDMEMTGIIPAKPTGVTNRTTLFGSENDMEITGVIPSKPTGVTNKTTLFGSENDMEMTRVDRSTGHLTSKLTGIPSKTTLFTSENDMDMTGVISSKLTGVTNKTKVFSSENEMEMTRLDGNRSFLPSKPTEMPNKTVVFSSENDMEMTRNDGKADILTSKPTGLQNKTRLFSLENDMEMTGVIPFEMTRVDGNTGVLSFKPTGLPKKTTVFSSENDMEMSHVDGNTGVLSSITTGVSDKTTVFSSENDMEMTGVILSKPTGVPDITTVFSSGNDMEETHVGYTDILLSNSINQSNRTTHFSSENNMEMTHLGRTMGDLLPKPTELPNKTTVFSSENDMDMTNVLQSKPTGMPNKTTVFSSENETDITDVLPSGAPNKSIVSLSENDKEMKHTDGKINQTIDNEALSDSAIDTEDDEITFKLPAGSEEALLSSEVNAEICENDVADSRNSQIAEVDVGSASSKSVNAEHRETTQEPESDVRHGISQGFDKQMSNTHRKSDDTKSVHDAVFSKDNTDDERDEYVGDVSLELVDLTGDQQLNFMKDSTMPEDVKNISVATKHFTTSSVSHISDISNASSIMPKTTQGVSFSVIDDMSMAADIASFDDFLSIFRIILYDPVVRGNSLCPPPVDDSDSLAEKLKVIYCMEPELQLIETGNEHLIALLSEHENVFRAQEAKVLPGLVDALKDDKTKKKMQGFIQKIQKICYEQARCDVKQLRLAMAQQVKKTLKENCNKLDQDIMLLKNIPEKVQSYSDDISSLKEAMDCVDNLKEVKNKADSLEEQVTKCTEKEQELQAKIETLKAQLELMPSPGKPTRDLKNQLFRLKESVTWKLIEFGPLRGVFSWLGGQVQLQLKFGEKVADCPNHRFVVDKSLVCNLGINAKCSNCLAANLMVKSSVLQNIACETTKQVPKLLNALSDIAYAVETIRKDLSAIEWFHDVSMDDCCGLLFSISEYKTISKLKLFLKFNPDHPDCPPQMSVEPLFGNIRKEKLLSDLQDMPAGPGFLRQLTATVETHLLQCPSSMDVQN